MSYLVLARKFRPQTFSALVGQEHISKALANAIIRGRVPHALLFTGPRGVGKTSSARVFARALNCTGRELPEPSAEASWEAVEPCGECPNCVEIAKSSSLAVWEIDGASNNSVDNVRDLIDSLRSLPPPGSQYKIYIIDEVHMLSVAAFNALLKSLEEPPPNTIFIFATTEPHKIPETVISRCQRHDFRRIGEAEIAQHLKKIAELEQLSVDEGVFSFLARRAQGGMRDAQSMFDRLISFGDAQINLDAAQRVFGVLDHSFFARLSAEIFAGNAEQCFSLVEKAFSQSLDVRTFLGDFLEHWRNLLLLAHRSESDSLQIYEQMVRLSAAEREELQTQLAGKDTFTLQRLFDIAEQTVSRAQQGMYPRYMFEAGVAKMLSLPTLRALPELLEELQKGGGAKSATGSLAYAAAEPVQRPSASAVEQSSAPNLGVQDSDLARDELPNQVEHDSAEPEIATAVPTAPEITPEVEVAPSVEFNPSWQSFVAHVRSRRMPILEALLKRVSPKQFTAGVLVAEASDFDRSTLLDSDTQQNLRDCLRSYSESDAWSISIDAVEGSTQGSAHLQGSVAAVEARKKRQSRAKTETEAKNDPAVQSVLNTFAGSKVERISILSK